MAILNYKLVFGIMFLIMAINLVSATIEYAPALQINNILFYDYSEGTYSKIGGYGDAVDYFPDDAKINDSLVFTSSTWGIMVGDRFVGKFKGIELNISTPLSATDINITWEYARAYDSSVGHSEWKPLNFTDNCNNFQNTGECNVTWTKADDWNNYFSIIVDGSSVYYSYWVRARITDVSGLTEGGKQSTSDLNIIHEAIFVDNQEVTIQDLYNASQNGSWDCVSGFEGNYILNCNLFLESNTTLTSKSESITFKTNWDYQNYGRGIYGELVGTVATINKPTWRFMEDTNSYYNTRFGFYKYSEYYGCDFLFTPEKDSLRHMGAWGGDIGTSGDKLVNFYGEGLRQISASSESVDFFGLRGEYPIEGTGGTVYDFKPYNSRYLVRFSGTSANNDYIHQSDFSGVSSHPIDAYRLTETSEVNVYTVDPEYGAYTIPEDRVHWLQSTTANTSSTSAVWDLSSVFLRITNTTGGGLSEVKVNITDLQSNVYELETNEDGYVAMGNSTKYYGSVTSVYDEDEFCDSSKSWIAGELKDKELYFTSGNGSGHRYILKDYGAGSCLKVATAWAENISVGTKYVILPHLKNKKYQPTVLSGTVYTSNVTYYNQYDMIISKEGYKDLETSFSLEKGLNAFIPMEKQPSWNYSIAPKFLIRNETTTGIFKISPEGNLAIAGELYENTNSPPIEEVLWKIGDLVYLTKTGNLYIKGEQVW